MAKTLLRVAGGFEIFFSLVGAGVSLILFLIFGVNLLTAFPFLLPLATAVIFLYVASLSVDEMKEKNKWILAFSILAFCTANIIVGILGIVAYMELKEHSPTVEKKVVDTRMRKMSLLLTLGVLLIVVAGIVFATSTWEFLDGFVKTCVLIVASLLFFGISHLAEYKLKLEKSSVTYYTLGLFFAVASYVSAGFFEVFGSWFAINGAGESLFLSSFCVFIAVMAGSAYGKYRKKEVLYFVETALTFAVLYILDFANVSFAWILLLFTLFFGVFVLANKEEKLPTLTVFANGVFVITIVALLIHMENIAETKLDLIITVISVVWTLSVLYVVALTRKISAFQIFAPIVSVMLLSGLLLFSGANGLAFLIKFALAIFIVYLIGFTKRKEKFLFGSTLAVTDLAFIYLIFDALRLEFGYFAIMVAIVFFLLSFLSIMAGKLSKFHFERFLEPLKIALLTYAIYDLLMIHVSANEGVFLGIMALIFAVVQLFKKELLKNIYFWTAIGSGLFTAWVSILETGSIVAPGLVAIVFAILFISASGNEAWKDFRNVIFAIFAVSLLMFVYRVTEQALGVVFYLMALSVFYLVLGLLFKKKSLLRNISFMTALIPLYTIAERLDLPYEVMSIVGALIVLLFIIGYTRGVLDGASSRFVNILEIVAIGIWFVGLIFNADFIQGIVLGTVAILFVLLGYKSDKLWSYYYVGIVATILNLWQQLESVWSKIPLWAYLLFAGLVLVGFVTYNEYAGEKKGEEEKMPVVEKDNEIVLGLSSERVISGTIIYLVIFLSVAGTIL